MGFEDCLLNGQIFDSILSCDIHAPVGLSSRIVFFFISQTDEYTYFFHNSTVTECVEYCESSGIQLLPVIYYIFPTLEKLHKIK